MIGFAVSVGLLISGFNNTAASTQLGNSVTTVIGGGLAGYNGLFLIKA